MTTRSLRSLFAVLPVCTLSAVLAVPVVAAAQQPWPGEQVQSAQPAAPAQPRTRPRAAAPAVSAEDELSPRQMQAPPAAPPGTRRAKPPAGTTAAVPGTPRPAHPASRGPQRTIACTGVFGRDSTHLKLAMAFDARNIVFTQVDGAEGTKLNASVVFPNDPKRRLEVLWQNEATRSDTALIVIGGQSQWIAPKGLRIGLPLAALEKANGKPFRLKGLDQENGGSVLDWDGGAMDSLPGGCKVGVRLAPDSKAPEAARAAVVGKEIASNDAALKPAKLAIAEIILGY